VPLSALATTDGVACSRWKTSCTTRVVSQHEAIRRFRKRFARAGPAEDPKGRWGSFIFAGPTAWARRAPKQARQVLFVNEEAWFSSEMRVCRRSTNVSGCGARRAYVDYEEGPTHRERFASARTAVVLLDEIEKSPSDVWELPGERGMGRDQSPSPFDPLSPAPHRLIFLHPPKSPFSPLLRFTLRTTPYSPPPVRPTFQPALLLHLLPNLQIIPSTSRIPLQIALFPNPSSSRFLPSTLLLPYSPPPTLHHSSSLTCPLFP